MKQLNEEQSVIGTYDFLYAFRFIQKLVTPARKTRAYKLGLIDKDYNILKQKEDLKSSIEKQQLTHFDLIIFNMKRHLKKYCPIKYKHWTSNIVMAMRELLEDQVQTADKEIIEEALKAWLIKEHGKNVISEESQEDRSVEEWKVLFTEEAVMTSGSGLGQGVQPDGSSTGNPGDGSEIAGYDTVVSTPKQKRKKKPKKSKRVE